MLINLHFIISNPQLHTILKVKNSADIRTHNEFKYMYVHKQIKGFDII